MEEQKEKKTSKKGKAGKIISWIFTLIFGGFFVFFAVGFIRGSINKKDNYNQNLIYGYGNFIVQTDSREPEYPVKTAIVTHKDSPSEIVREWESIHHSTTKESHIDLTFMDSYSGSFTSASEIAELKDTYNEETSNINRVITHRLRCILVDETKKEGEGRYLFYVAGINTSAHQAEKGQYQVFSEKELLGVVKVNSPALGGFRKFIASPWGLIVLLLIPALFIIVSCGRDIYRARKEPDEETAAVSGLDKPNQIELSEEDKKRLKEEMLNERLNKKKGDDK